MNSRTTTSNTLYIAHSTFCASKAVVFCYVVVLILVFAFQFNASSFSALADPGDNPVRDQDCLSGTHEGFDADYLNDAYPNGAAEIPCDVIIGAKVEQNSASLTVKTGDYTKDTANGSWDIANQIVLFPPFILAPDATPTPNDSNPDTIHVMGDHFVSLTTGNQTGAVVSLNAHTSPKHGIATGSYEGQMVCVAFCTKQTVYEPKRDPNSTVPGEPYDSTLPQDLSVHDPSTFIGRNTLDCAANSTNRAGPLYGVDNGDIPEPCILAPNTWGYKIGNDTSCNYNPNTGYNNDTACQGKRNIDLKPVPSYNHTPASIIHATSNAYSTYSNNVFYATSTNKSLRPGVYGVTTVYTLTVTPP